MNLKNEQMKDLPIELIQFSKQELLPSEIKGLNPSTLFRDLRHNMSRVDDFNHFMDQYNKKSLLGKLWNSDQLENAMVDSISVQGDVLKTTSKLIVLNTYFSKVLNDQQVVLKEQQDQIHEQTTKNKEFTENIATLQRAHKEDQDKLSLRVKSALEAMGLNQDQILLLLDLEENFQNSVKTFESAKAEIKNLIETTIYNLRDEVDKNLSTSKEYIDVEVENIYSKLITNEQRFEEESKKQMTLNSEIDQKIQQFHEDISELNKDLSMERDKAEMRTTSTQNNFTDIVKNIDYMKDDFKAFRENHENKIQKLIIIFSAVTVGLSSLVVFLLVR